jgi:hypothetical protein
MSIITIDFSLKGPRNDRENAILQQPVYQERNLTPLGIIEVTDFSLRSK